MRYKISDKIQFVPVSGHLKNTIAENRVLLKDDFQERQFFVNQTTRVFIQKFYSPKTFAELNKEIALETKADIQKVKKIILPFFNYIRYRKFIVPENYIHAKIKANPIFNKEAILDCYKIESLIDTNDDIEVYKAVDLTNATSVVIKLLKCTKTRKLHELKREFAFLQTLCTSEIAPVPYTFKIKENYAYFAQEYIEGLSLPQFIHRKKQSPSKTIFFIASKILNAFKEIHLRNIIHGDIHPSNIIITPGNNVKIIDFGLALNNELDKDEVVNFGGAYFFMPPERIKKTTYHKFTRKPDFHSDVFQLGVVLYMLLYNDYPFNGITWEELALEIKEKAIEFPGTSHFSFRVPEWLTGIITKCIAKKPKERFLDAEDLYNDFSKNLNDNARKIRSTIKI